MTNTLHGISLSLSVYLLFMVIISIMMLVAYIKIANDKAINKSNESIIIHFIMLFSIFSLLGMLSSLTIEKYDPSTYSSHALIGIVDRLDSILGELRDRSRNILTEPTTANVRVPLSISKSIDSETYGRFGSIFWAAIFALIVFIILSVSITLSNSTRLTAWRLPIVIGVALTWLLGGAFLTLKIEKIFGDLKLEGQFNIDLAREIDYDRMGDIIDNSQLKQIDVLTTINSHMEAVISKMDQIFQLSLPLQNNIRITQVGDFGPFRKSVSCSPRMRTGDFGESRWSLPDNIHSMPFHDGVSALKGKFDHALLIILVGSSDTNDTRLYSRSIATARYNLGHLRAECLKDIILSSMSDNVDIESKMLIFSLGRLPSADMHGSTGNVRIFTIEIVG